MTPRTLATVDELHGLAAGYAEVRFAPAVGPDGSPTRTSGQARALRRAVRASHAQAYLLVGFSEKAQFADVQAAARAACAHLAAAEERASRAGGKVGTLHVPERAGLGLARFTPDAMAA